MLVDRLDILCGHTMKSDFYAPMFEEEMKTIKFQDSSQNEIQVSFSGGGDIRVYITQKISNEEKMMCMLLNEHQANILIHAIKDLLSQE